MYCVKSVSCFSFFNLESSLNCNADYVEVREAVGSRVIGRYCGNQLPNNLTASQSLRVKFRSNENTPGQGFMATYNSRKNFIKFIHQFTDLSSFQAKVFAKIRYWESEQKWM